MLYDDLVAAGCKIDSHESDLYVEATNTSRSIIRQYANGGAKLNVSTFISPIDGKWWIEILFEYAPFWRSHGVPD